MPDFCSTKKDPNIPFDQTALKKFTVFKVQLLNNILNHPILLEGTDKRSIWYQDNFFFKKKVCQNLYRMLICYLEQSRNFKDFNVIFKKLPFLYLNISICRDKQMTIFSSYQLLSTDGTE